MKRTRDQREDFMSQPAAAGRGIQLRKKLRGRSEKGALNLGLKEEPSQGKELLNLTMSFA